MERYVVTGFNQESWTWGISWLLSLQQIAKYQGNIVIVDFDLSKRVKSKLSENNVLVIPGELRGDIRLSVFHETAKFAKEHPGIFAIWDADAYFQDDISGVFDLAPNKFAMTHHSGLLAAPSHLWWLLDEVESFVTLAEGFCVTENFLSCLHNFFGEYVTIVEDSWNWVDMFSLKDDGKHLVVGNTTPKVIHPNMRSCLAGKNLLFTERHKSLYDQYMEVSRRISPRFLARKY